MGSAIGQLLAEAGLNVSGMRRSQSSQPTRARMLVGDVTQPASLACLGAVDPYILVYCVAASESSDESYRAHYVDGLRNVLAALHQAKNLRHVFFVSSTRVYGQAGDALLNESDIAMPSDFGGKRLLEAEYLLANLPCGHTVLRLSGIYGPGRRYMLRLAGDPSAWPQQSTWTNRIHRDDAAAFIAWLIRPVTKGESVDSCYIVTDSRPVPQHEVLRWLAASLGVDVGAAITPPPSGGKRLSNARMLATGFRLRYPDYQAGYASLLQQENE